MDRQTGKAEKDRHTRTGRIGKAKLDRKKRAARKARIRQPG
jgi:hypothetical protein